jgi:hypothetical protein
MPKRAIAPSTEPFDGQVMTLDLWSTFTLHLPTTWVPPEEGGIHLTVHFHGAEWFALQEHERRGLAEPLITFYPGEGSSIYRTNFEDPSRFPALLAAAGAVLGDEVTSVDLTSYSAGYGAVREILRQPENRAMVRRVVLGDSMYGSLDPDALEDGRRLVLAEHVAVWLPFAREAMEGHRTFVLTYSMIETVNHASCFEMARALAAALELPMEPVKPGSLPATLDPDFPLVERADAGNLHLWGYGGKTGDAHMTHPRHLADVWLALDKAGKP